MTLNLSQRQRRLRYRRLGPQSQFPISDIMPRAHLVADLVVNTDGTEPDRFVQPDAARIRQRDARIGVVVALRGQDSKQRRIQSLADSPPPKIGVHINGGIYGP